MKYLTLLLICAFGTSSLVAQTQFEYTGESSYFTPEQMKNDSPPESKFKVKVLYYEAKKKYEIYSPIKLVYTLYKGDFIKDLGSSQLYKGQVYENEKWYTVKIAFHFYDFAVIFDDGSTYYYSHYE